MTLTEAKNMYLREHKLRGSTLKTISNYKDILSAFIKYTGDIEVKELDLELINNYQENLYDRRLSNSSVRCYLRHIKAFVHFLEEEGIIENNEMYKKIRLPKKSDRVVDLFTPEEMAMIFDNITGSPNWIRLRNCLIVALMYDSGLRQAELCRIMKDDISGDGRLLKVHGKGNKERYVPLGDTAQAMMEEYLNECPFQSEYLLIERGGGQLTTNAVKIFINKLRNKVDLPNLCSHKLRHNFATNYVIDMYRENGNVDLYKLSAILGHEDIETTKIYLHLANQIIASSGCFSHLDYIKKTTVKN